jgi:hypothetical protein
VTQPAEPTPGASETQPGQTAPGAPEGQSTTPDPKQDSQDISSLPDWAQKQIRDARAEAAKSRTSAKQTAAQEARQQTLAEVAKALGLSDDVELSPEQMTEQISDAQTAAWFAVTEAQVWRVAAKYGANAEALLDSRSFLDSLEELDGDNPRDPEFLKQLEAKVQAAVEQHTHYRTAGQAPSGTPKPDPSQGSRGPATERPKSLGDAIAQHYAQK